MKEEPKYLKDSTSSRGTPPRVMTCWAPKRSCVDIAFVFEALIRRPTTFDSVLSLSLKRRLSWSELTGLKYVHGIPHGCRSGSAVLGHLTTDR